MDFALPSMNGAVATRQILRTAPETAILILSMHSEPSYVRTCLEAGARGYLLKNAMDLELVDAVKQVAAGEQVLDPRLGQRRWGTGRTAGATDHARAGSAAVDRARQIEQRDRRVLGLSANTVAVHRANIMQTLGIHNTAELVVYAIRQGLVSIA